MEQIEKKTDFVKFYPNYIEKTAKVSEGRKVSAEIAIENVNSHEILKVVSEYLRFPCKVEYVKQFNIFNSETPC